MKRWMEIALASMLFSLPCAMRAQDAPPPALPQADSTRPAAAGQRTPEQLLRYYDTKLSLTEDQKAQLKPLIADRQQKMQDLRTDSSTRLRDKMKKLQAITADSDKKINAVLTPDQHKKYAELEKQMREQAKERREQQKNP